MTFSPFHTTSHAQPPLPRMIRLTLLVWGALLRICPRAFRVACACEMEQVFRALLLDAWRERGAWGVARLWAPAVADLARGASGAHLDELGLSLEALRRSWRVSRMRASAITMFSAYIALVLTGMGFQKLTEDIMKTSAPTSHPSIALAYQAIIAGAVLALLAVVVGGAPIAWASMRQALAARRYSVLALWAVPPISLLVWLGWLWTLLNVIWPSSSVINVRQTEGLWLARSLIILFILAAVASIAAVAAAVSRSDVSAATYRFGLRAAVVATLGMLLTAGGVAAFALQVQSFAPADLSGLASPLLFGESTGTSLLIQTIVMIVATAIAAISVYRGLGAPDAPAGGAPALA